MTKKNILVFLLLLGFFAVSFLILTFDVFGEEKPPEFYNISVIVRGKNSDSWESIKQGAEQAASEMNVELSFITLSEENNIEEQVALLNREHTGDADAIVLSASDSTELVDTIEHIAEDIPVVCIESPVESPSVSSYVSADNFEMGIQLGEEIIKSGNSRKRLAVVENSSGVKSVQLRRDGLMSVLGQFGGDIYRWTIPNNTDEAKRGLARELRKKEVDVVVTLDTAALELTAQAVSEEQAYYLDLFGIGASGRIASFIEQDIITATVVQNDFGIGYLGIKAAVDQLKHLTPEPEIQVEYRVINWKNMYDPENQRLIFPFIR